MMNALQVAFAQRLGGYLGMSNSQDRRAIADSCPGRMGGLSVSQPRLPQFSASDPRQPDPDRSGCASLVTIPGAIMHGHEPLWADVLVNLDGLGGPTRTLRKDSGREAPMGNRAISGAKQWSTGLPTIRRVPVGLTEFACDTAAHQKSRQGRKKGAVLPPNSFHLPEMSRRTRWWPSPARRWR